jgi:hypothetical protein
MICLHLISLLSGKTDKKPNSGVLSADNEGANAQFECAESIAGIIAFLLFSFATIFARDESVSR